MSERARQAILGGTFDRLHAGHRALLAEGFATGDSVLIGLTSPLYLRTHPKRGPGRIAPYLVRRKVLARFLRRTYPRRSFDIVSIDDPFGGALESGAQVIVVSEETRHVVAALNLARKRLGRPPLKVHVVSQMLADDGLPIQSRRIRAGAIDRDGHIVRGPRILLVGGDAATRKAVQWAVRRRFFGSPVRFGISRKETANADSWDYQLLLGARPLQLDAQFRVRVVGSDGRSGPTVAGHGGQPERLAQLVAEAFRPWSIRARPAKI